jgi:hypothetical protein
MSNPALDMDPLPQGSAAARDREASKFTRDGREG